MWEKRIFYRLNSPVPASKHKDCIWWSLEYGGGIRTRLERIGKAKYGHPDPIWAERNNAKLVVMGSHPDLKRLPTFAEWTFTTI